jgi:hypothetical protein
MKAMEDASEGQPSLPMAIAKAGINQPAWSHSAHNYTSL